MKNENSKNEYWQKHVATGRKYPDGIAAYCRQEGIQVGSFHYWRRKIDRPTSLPATTPSFIPVSVSRVEQSLPNQDWLARFVFCGKRRNSIKKIVF